MSTIKTITKNVAPLQKRDALKSFQLNATVTRYTTDPNGIIQNPVPLSMQKAMPFHLFGDFDKAGGYAIGDMIVNNSGLPLFATYVNGLNTPLFFFNPFAEINGKMKRGDLVFVYVDDVNAPNFFNFVIVSSPRAGFASLVNQTNISQIDDNGYWGAFKFFGFSFSWGDESQLLFPLTTIKTKFNGDYATDIINPYAYRFIDQKENSNKVVIPLEFICNQYSGLSGLIPYTNPYIEFLFNLYL